MHTAGSLIDELQKAIDAVPPGSLEEIYQTACVKMLSELGLTCTRPRVSNPDAGGYGHVDILVNEIDPPLLIELKSTGDWRAVAEAAAQLYGYDHLLCEQGHIKPAVKLAIFGTKLQSSYLAEYLELLETRFLCKGTSIDTRP